MADQTIQVKGIRDLQRALRDIDRDLAKQLGEGLAEVADIVAKTARPLVPVKTGRAASSMKVRKTQRAASLAVGGTKAPYFQWLEWGGRTGRNKSVVRPFIPIGRTIYPTVKEKDAEIKNKLDEVLRRLAIQAGFETTGDAAHG